MNPVLLNIILLVFGAAVGGVASSLILKGRKFVDLEKTQRQSVEMLEKSQLEAKTIKSETESSVEKHKATIDEWSGRYGDGGTPGARSGGDPRAAAREEPAAG